MRERGIIDIYHCAGVVCVRERRVESALTTHTHDDECIFNRGKVVRRRNRETDRTPVVVAKPHHSGLLALATRVLLTT